MRGPELSTSGPPEQTRPGGGRVRKLKAVCWYWDISRRMRSGAATPEQCCISWAF